MVVVARGAGAALASSTLTAALFTVSAIVVATGVTSVLPAAFAIASPASVSLARSPGPGTAVSGTGAGPSTAGPGAAASPTGAGAGHGQASPASWHAPGQPRTTVGAKHGARGTAREVPGVAALDKGGGAVVSDVSCGSAGNCAATGTYTDASHHLQVFVASEKAGTWGTAIEVPGTGSLNKGDGGSFPAVSCASAGNCAVTGSYTDASGHVQAFAADEKNGTWGQAHTLASRIPGQVVRVFSLSCARSAGNCATVGQYRRPDNGTGQAFVADEKNGTWGAMITVPGSDLLNAGGEARATSVSCGPAGDCAVTGTYADASSSTQAFVANEVTGTWGQASGMPVTGAPANTTVQAAQVSCASTGQCAVTGSFRSIGEQSHVYVAVESGGTWGPARPLPGESTLTLMETGAATAISCSSPGNCATGGDFSGSTNPPELYVSNEQSGTWDQAQQLFGTVDFNTATATDFRSVSCAADGDCSAAGWFTAGGHSQAFTASEVDGSWGGASPVPGLATLSTGGLSNAVTVSCASPGNCATGGFYQDASHRNHAFIADQSTATTTTLALSAAMAKPGQEQAVRLTVKVTPRAPGSAPVPGGSVTVGADEGSTICVITLSGGTGGCTMSAGQFGPGTYQLTAAYSGDQVYDGSASARGKLTVTQHGVWGGARQVPGLAALDKGGFSSVAQVSCGSPGNCAAVGAYAAAHAPQQALIAEERNGTWGSVRKVPGIPALTKGSSAADLVSCRSPGNCTLAGSLVDNPRAAIAFGSAAGGAPGPAATPGGVTSGPASVVRPAVPSDNDAQALVADEKNGTWGNARKVPGLNALAFGNESADSLSCGSPGNCALVGSYTDARHHAQAFVAEEKNGTWGNAREIPGTAALNMGDANAAAVSCPAAGSCTVAGTYTDAQGASHAFVADERGGTWGQAREVAIGNGTSGGIATGVSCATAGNCTAIGNYTDAGGHRQAFLTDEVGGTWPVDRIQTIPGVAIVNTGGDASATTVSCSSAGNCAAGGTYTTIRPTTQSFIAEERGGTWADARKLTVTVANAPDSATTVLDSLSCPSPGNCAASGSYADGHGFAQAFTANEVTGMWGRASLIPGITSLDKDAAPSQALSVSCRAAGKCVAGGVYTDPSGFQHAFVAEQSPVTSTALTLSATTVHVGHEQAGKLTVTVTPRTAGTPGGTVTVKAGGTTVCVITLSSAKGSCTLRPSQLKAGKYQLTAAYGGSDVHDGSTSAAHSLTVAK